LVTITVITLDFTGGWPGGAWVALTSDLQPAVTALKVPLGGVLGRPFEIVPAMPTQGPLFTADQVTTLVRLTVAPLGRTPLAEHSIVSPTGSVGVGQVIVGNEGGIGLQNPFSQSWPTAHLFPHMPQFFSSAIRFTQVPEQRTIGGVHLQQYSLQN
jgi:hypothetical protein